MKPIHAARVLVLSASVALCGLPCVVSAQEGSKPPAAAGEHPGLDLGRDMDAALRWLRQSQDRESGAYGASVETTAWVLRGMIQSHRRYQRIDGPFVERALEFLIARQRADGAICDAAAQGEAVAAQTRAAAAALALHADASTQPPLAKALAFLGPQPGEAPPWDDAPLPASRAELAARVTELLAQRAPDGSWDGPRGRVDATAKNLVLLARAAPALQPAPKPPAAIQPLAPPAAANRAKVREAQAKGAQYLLAQSQDGRFGQPGKPDAGLTAMALNGLLALPEPRPAETQKAIDQGLAWLASLQQPDGSIHDGKTANYTTSAAILALVSGGKPEHAPVVAKARDWLVALQVGEEDGYSADDPYYGGIGYGSGERPDLSNLQYALEALTASGLAQDHQAFQRSLRFLQRCQNRSESNDVSIPLEGGVRVVSGDDGGSAYLPGQSFAGYVELEGGRRVPRSYGSMTYALLKGFIFAGLPKDDARMRAAWDWIRKNWSLDVNPGFGAGSDPGEAYQGLYYYFHTMAKALDLYGEETLVDGAGKPHAWRAELSGRLLGMQSRTDGSWVNENSPRWYEGNRVLATSYALTTLSLALPRE
jgi:squalene-hopene/tetraprenyl-beta-curcumene cyclase